jgi:cellobiose-specific phosphotransferase system component IIC
VEGIAIHFSKEWVPGRHETLLEHVFTKSIVPLNEITRKFPTTSRGADLAYAQSQDALRWLVETNGSEALWSIIDKLHTGANLNAAFEAVLGYNLDTFDKLWRESLPQRYHWASFLSSSYVFWGGLGGLFLLTYLICWNRRRRQLNKLAQQEEMVDPFFRE